jgi:hypothetical protein
MFEYHGWAVVKSTSGRQVWKPDGLYFPDDELLHERLIAVIDDIEVGEWVHFHQTVNGLASLTLSGLRNHRDRRIFELFEWLADNGKRSYGFLFCKNVEDDDRDYDYDFQFRVYRLAWGAFKELPELLDISPPPE